MGKEGVKGELWEFAECSFIKLNPVGKFKTSELKGHVHESREGQNCYKIGLENCFYFFRNEVNME